MSLGSQINVEKFINAVYKRVPLWDQRDDGHHNRFVLNKLWEEVGRDFGISRDIARSKWKSLRDKFRGIISRNPDTEHRGHIWPHFTSLLFLRDQFLSDTSTTYSDSFSILSDHIQCKIEQTSSTTDEHFDEKFLNGIEVVATPQTSPSHSRLSPVCIDDNVPNRKRKNECNGNECGVSDADCNGNGCNGGNTCDDTRKRRKYDSEDDDEDLNFFKSLVPHIRTIPSFEKLSLRIKILQCIQGYMNKGNNKTNLDSTPMMTPISNTTTLNSSKQTEAQKVSVMTSSSNQNHSQTENGTSS